MPVLLYDQPEVDGMTYRTETLRLTWEEEKAIHEELEEVGASRKQVSWAQSKELVPDENAYQHDSHDDTTHEEQDWNYDEEDEHFSIECPESAVDVEDDADASIRQVIQTEEVSSGWDEYLSTQETPPTQDTSEWDVDSDGNPIVYCNVDTFDIPAPEVKKAERLGNPFRELHYFYHYIVTTSERTCLAFARGHPSWNLDSQDFLRIRLDDPQNPYGRSNLADKEWNQAGQVEICDWSFFFEKLAGIRCSHEQRRTVFDCLDRVRQAAVHRKHSLVDKEVLEIAMLLPSLMRDGVRDAEMTRIYSILRKDIGHRTSEEQEFFNKRVYTQENRPTSIHEFLAHIQYLCETSAFEYARTADPGFLTYWHACCPEGIELQHYQDRWSDFSISVDPHPSYQETYLKTHGNTDGIASLWRLTLNDMRQLRIDATHRAMRTDPRFADRNTLMKRVQWASTFVAMMGDQEMVARVQRVGKEWLDEYGPKEEDEEKGT